MITLQCTARATRVGYRPCVHILKNGTVQIIEDRHNEYTSATLAKTRAVEVAEKIAARLPVWCPGSFASVTVA